MIVHVLTNGVKSKMKILNLYAGIWGNRKLWGENHEVTAVEFDETIASVYQKNFPNDNVVVGCAKEYLLQHFKEFDFIWASPPCQTHSKMRFLASKRGSYEPKIPDLSLYESILFLKHFIKDKQWVVENVIPYYEPLIKPTMKIERHYFWSNFPISIMKEQKSEIKHNKVTGKTIKYGFDLTKEIMNKRKDQIIRNCVKPKIGKHILDCAMGISGQKTLILD